MPDPEKPDPPPVVVKVNRGGDESSPYAGPDRRAGPPGVPHRDVTVNVPARDDEPAWQRDWPRWAKLLWHMGPFTIICGAMVVIGGCFMRERASDRANDRADRMEEREIRRAEAAQYQRQNEIVAAKFDALVAKIDAGMERAATGRVTVEKLAKELTEALEKVMEALKRLKAGEADPVFGFVNPIPWLADHAPPKAMPAVTPGGARE